MAKKVDCTPLSYQAGLPTDLTRAFARVYRVIVGRSDDLTI